ncbi:septum site determining protein MinC [Candidatus Blochmanniella floridana]|uniref:Probable septum site-determining protein MinC n=1 Tax=Blochmanniella floridana TaxID=203907 RepID=MINC_BLOFL|nr:RecName: Full=Probable septum site-determining protein MinC [Candidatus Blochmannia floridanus]CAD83501.1 septum site determining protein MinC [Candidatus Blochmannia floridanus]
MLESVSVDLQGNNFTLLVIQTHTTCTSQIQLELTQKIKNSPSFFSNNTPVVINVENINHHDDWFNLYQTISNIGLFIIGVCCCYNKKLKNIITQSGLPILTKGNIIKSHKNTIKTNYTKPTFDDKTNAISKTQTIHTPIRSGQRIYARNRDLIIISNVSSGAEVIADGNIHIYGSVRGRVLAGASGCEQSQIFCTKLSPELISIGGYYWLNDQIPPEFLGKSARFYLQNHTLIIQHIS